MGWKNTSGYCFNIGDIVEDAEDPLVNGKVVAVDSSGNNLVIIRSDGRGWPKEDHDYTQHLPEGTKCWHVLLDDLRPHSTEASGFKVGDFICDKSSNNVIGRILLVDEVGDYLTERAEHLPKGTKCWGVLKKNAAMSTRPWQEMSFAGHVGSEHIIPLLRRTQAEMRSARVVADTFDSIRLQLLRDL